MQEAPISADEKERLDAVHRLAILDTKPEERFDVLTNEAVKELKVPIAMVSILDSDREWFKSCVGLDTKEISILLGLAERAEKELNTK
jgi:hypothetical protein